MPTFWPFVGRTSTLDEVRRLLSGPAARGVVVAGDAGVGKTRLVAEALGRLDPGTFTVLQVGATRATAAIPLGAFGHVLPVRWPGAGVVNPLRWASEALRPPAESAPLLVAVDDAHLLDPTSAALIHHLVLHEKARVLATIRTGETAPDPVLALWKDELTRRLDLGPLSVAETQVALEGALGGQLDVGTAERLWRLTRGNLLFLRELVLAGRAAGSLSPSGGVWRWRGELPVTPRLRELVEARLGNVEDDEQEVVDYVAFGEPVGAVTLAGLTSEAAVDRAEDKQLIELVRSGNRLEARLAHPIYGEVARARAGGLRTRRLLAALAAAVEATGARRRDDLLRVAVWRLNSGTTTRPEQTTAACLLAKSVYDITLAERLGRAALASGGGLDAALALAGVLFVSGSPEEGEAVLADAAGLAHGDVDRARYAATRALGLVLSNGRFDTAFEVLDEAAATISAVQPRQQVEVARGRVYAQLGELPAAQAALDRIRALGPLSPQIAAHASGIEAVALGYAGRLDDCLALAAAAPGGGASTAEEIPGAELDIACAEMLALLFSGRPAAAIAAVDRVFERFQGSVGVWELGVAGFLGHRGQLRRMTGAVGDALRACREGAAHLSPGPAGFAGLCLGELAHAAALLGRREIADRALAEAERRSLRTFYLIDFPMRLARPWVLALGGHTEAAVTAALETADEAESRGLGGYRLFALHDVVRLGAATQAVSGLVGLTARMDGALVRVCARHATAAAASDGDELDGVSLDFADMGFVLHAAEASAQAARAYERAGRPRQAHAAETRAWVLARRCQGARTPALARLAAPELTARQLEIAQLAGAGLSNREIAGRLVLSIRTVANHLGAVYERLGVNDRAQLAGLLGPVAE